jgi:hypothetical protein
MTKNRAHTSPYGRTVPQLELDDGTLKMGVDEWLSWPGLSISKFQFPHFIKMSL